ncbi:hypothetical protein FHX52_3076 [Humibacillus xanthopallidus]|uniref:Uncharacterized protein n=1 Tax=Humibacillus xanthopallidus TaxID=412689 RepID=A0A543PQL1_9MICO|nr:hypothetical protein [Humibacillus xanthopallidus]TQN46355.1 hypothetical protein FHX52_3076 [Humibacillus xanthopallidus]
MRPDVEAADPWTVVVRGSFLVGLCGTCAWSSPARRARYSVEGDMRAHEVLCRSAAPAQEPVGSRATGQPDDVASGRERLSAQGRS